MNVAHLAGLPQTIVDTATKMANLFEKRLEEAHRYAFLYDGIYCIQCSQ